MEFVRQYERTWGVTLSMPKDEVVRTKQSFKAECDINRIMAKYQKSGAIDHFNRYSADYGFVPAVDFLEAVQTAQRGEAVFAALPSSLRSRFRDAGAFLEFVQDPGNADEMLELGLRKKPQKPQEGAGAGEPKAPAGDPSPAPSGASEGA